MPGSLNWTHSWAKIVQRPINEVTEKRTAKPMFVSYCLKISQYVKKMAVAVPTIIRSKIDNAPHYPFLGPVTKVPWHKTRRPRGL